MATKKVAYYGDEGPEVPAAGGDYSAPTPHAAVASQHPFAAPSSLPTGNAAPVDHAAFDFMDGHGWSSST